MHSETCQVVELRRYALHPDDRETLIELFDRELVETQEAVGMDVLGQFRDLDDPDSFVWFVASATCEHASEDSRLSMAAPSGKHMPALRMPR